MRGYWSRFARSGDPNEASASAWPRWSATAREALELGDTVRPVAHPELSLCAALMPDSTR